MNRIGSLFTASALGLLCLHASAQKTLAPSLCAASEEPVFSCTLKGPARKMVSLCASTASAQQGGRSFHYLYGRPSKIELRYPASGNGSDAFTFTRLRFAGATGGYAHTFSNGDYKYILYSIEGTGFKESGLLVQRQGSLHASREMHCSPTTLTTVKNDELWSDAVSKWKVDADIESHGSLPYANR
ncbi:hypothetical protein QTH89_10580 [Variovorax sp. J22G21]|uniref:hypothetical protein n=1 Tax=Variovorax fucosicus TaxID=3053517 RepID=UPI002578F53C|nr:MULTISPECIES: hypothetical protein [unclassified Variovorax]MDM0040274.1 hypothetical protein [Variovorax sp. J22R193]MDM0058392.1 hypothetical protein [Variovorax sp. J22G47]MDM0061647.1 hypothetical protein [Variovorax sp. J22G21]